jgi:hypothetical protein
MENKLDRRFARLQLEDYRSITDRTQNASLPERITTDQETG